MSFVCFSLHGYTKQMARTTPSNIHTTTRFLCTPMILKRLPFQKRKNPLQIARGRALLKLKRYRECLDYLETVDLLPSEHGGSATDIWQEAQKALGLPPTWPENLGKGEPYPDRKRKKQETSN